MNSPIRPRSVMAICALATAVGAGTAGVYTLTTTSGSTVNSVEPPVAAEDPAAPPSTRDTTDPASTTTTTKHLPAPTSSIPSPPPAPRPPETTESEDHTTSNTTPTVESDEEPTTTTTTPAPARSPGTVVVALVNEARDEAGCGPVTTDARLSRAAVAHSADMAERDYFAHLSPEGLSFVQRALEEGYPTPAAENIAMGQRTAKQVMRGWMESEDHRENILDCSLTSVGVGLSASGWYWTQVFGR